MKKNSNEKEGMKKERMKYINKRSRKEIMNIRKGKQTWRKEIQNRNSAVIWKAKVFRYWSIRPSSWNANRRLLKNGELKIPRFVSGGPWWGRRVLRISWSWLLINYTLSPLIKTTGTWGCEAMCPSLYCTWTDTPHCPAAMYCHLTGLGPFYSIFVQTESTLMWQQRKTSINTTALINKC